MTAIDFSKRCIVFVTGASRGIGRSIALEISRKLHQTSILVLLARSKAGLDETKAHVGEVDKSLTVLTYCTDFSNPNIENYNEIFKQVLGTVETKDLHYGIMIHNAGHIGTVKQTTDLTDLSSWTEHFNVSLFSLALLNSVFIKQFRPVAPQLCVINISSLAGRAPFANLAMYGSGKAAREQFFKVLALEAPSIIVLNYCPGPVDTDMFNDILKTAQSEEVKNTFKEVKEKSILSPPVTVNKMLELLEKGDFKNGDSIDYYDRI